MTNVFKTDGECLQDGFRSRARGNPFHAETAEVAEPLFSASPRAPREPSPSRIDHPPHQRGREAGDGVLEVRHLLHRSGEKALVISTRCSSARIANSGSSIGMLRR